MPQPETRDRILDAAEALFAPLADLDRYDLWPETARVIREAAQRFPAPA